MYIYNFQGKQHGKRTVSYKLKNSLTSNLVVYSDFQAFLTWDVSVVNFEWGFYGTSLYLSSSVD